MIIYIIYNAYIYTYTCIDTHTYYLYTYVQIFIDLVTCLYVSSLNCQGEDL